MSDREKLIELIEQGTTKAGEHIREVTKKALAEKGSFSSKTDYDRRNIYEVIADYLLENGVIVPPCKVGDVVYYISENPLNLSVQANTIYEADVARIVTTRYGTTLIIQIHNSYGCTEIPDVNDWGKTVFPTKEEAEQALKGGAK